MVVTVINMGAYSTTNSFIANGTPVHKFSDLRYEANVWPRKMQVNQEDSKIAATCDTILLRLQPSAKRTKQF